MGGWALRELCVGFRLQYRLSYRLRTNFLVFRYDNDNYSIAIVIDVFEGPIVSQWYCFDIENESAVSSSSQKCGNISAIANLMLIGKRDTLFSGTITNYSSEASF